MRSFMALRISLDGNQYPIQFEPKQLVEFERDTLDHVDKELKNHLVSSYGPCYFEDQESRLGIVASLLSRALSDQDSRGVEKYVLWIATRFPEISGINISQDTYEFVNDTFSMVRPEGDSLH